MGRKYKNPPIVEALCEFQFVPGQPWDLTITGLFYDKIKDNFPEKQQQTRFGVGFRPTEGGVEQKVEMTPRMQFRRKDQTALIQSGPNLLVINHLKPYPTWKDFKPMILQNLEIYQDIAKPEGFKRIGLRYINRIEIPEKLVEVTDYFKFYPFIPPDLPQTHGDFNVRIEISYEEDHDKLLLTLGSILSKETDKIAIMLDLDYIMTTPEKIRFKEVKGWIDKAHTAIENAFEACITDKCRNLFKEEK